jgi:hypothetical protein
MSSTKRFAFFSCARGAFAFGALLPCFIALPAYGTIIGMVEITATTPNGSGTADIGVPLSGDWLPANPTSIKDSNGDVVATVKEVTLATETDPAVSLGFFVTAGAVTTTFTISSPVVSFAPLSNQSGSASAGVTLTDNDGDGASSTGLFAVDKAYEARYNTSSVFADLVSPVSAGSFGTWTTSEHFPGAGTSPIAGSVSNILSQFSFTLSPNDSASGTSVFRIVPEPSSMVLALVGGLALLWRARRRQF